MMGSWYVFIKDIYLYIEIWFPYSCVESSLWIPCRGYFCIWMREVNNKPTRKYQRMFHRDWATTHCIKKLEERYYEFFSGLPIEKYIETIKS